jgi:hypothetical protein
MVNVIGVPEQIGVAAAELVNLGVTVIVAVIGEAPVFVAVNVGKFPVPVKEVKPIEAPVTLHSKTVLDTLPVKTIGFEVAL